MAKSSVIYHENLKYKVAALLESKGYQIACNTGARMDVDSLLKI